MANLTQQVQSYLRKASPRFRTVYAEVDRSVRNLFPKAQASFQFRMPGWIIPRPRWVDPKSAKGTIDPNRVYVFLVERKSGITLHLWNPADLDVFRKRKADLERAGFKLMVGCIQFNRKSDYPIGLVVELLKDVKRSLDEDAKRAGEPPKGRSAARAPTPAKEKMSEELRRELDEWAAEPPMDGGD